MTKPLPSDTLPSARLSREWLPSDGAPQPAALRQIRALEVTVVETDGCHFCEDAHKVLDDLVAQGYAVAVTTLDLGSPKGRALMRQHRAGLSPLVLVEGHFFSHGRLPRGRLFRLLDDRLPGQRPAGGA